MLFRIYRATLYLLALLFFTGVFLPGSAGAQAEPLCQGRPATIVYVGYESVVKGTPGADVVIVEGGWNTIETGEGDDVVCAVGHFNTLYGGAGDDVLVSTGIYNVLYGEAGADALITDGETGTMNGGPGQNSCNGASC